MATLMHAGFLKDPAEYDRAELVWRDCWNAVIRELGEHGSWKTPWMTAASNDGTPFRDGNPIFSAVCRDRHLGVRVIQLEPADDPNELSFWTDTFGEGEPDAIKELVIDCVLSDQTLREAEAVMKRWITEEKASQSRRAS